MQIGYVYFIATQDLYVKIGFAEFNPYQRLSQLQIGSPTDLTLLGVISDIPRRAEIEIHAFFKADHIRGEWFRLSTNLRDFIQHNTTQLDAPLVRNKKRRAELRAAQKKDEAARRRRARKHKEMMKKKRRKMLPAAYEEYVKNQ